MSASNYSWICFDCRRTYRRPKTALGIQLCIECGGECHCLGYKVEIPKKENAKAWRKLRDACRELALTELEEKREARVREIHEAERRIARLGSLAENKDRAKIIEELKKKTRGEAPACQR
ncbi:MAG: hypothetical protein LBI02_02200 [Opitutaceae bacterium]|jgi:hypothetical protein|nr:hypothetical protein [Opitutaceae bacterium]